MLAADYFAGKTGWAEVAVARPALAGGERHFFTDWGGLILGACPCSPESRWYLDGILFLIFLAATEQWTTVLLPRSPLKILRFAARAALSP